MKKKLKEMVEYVDPDKDWIQAFLMKKDRERAM